MELQILVRYQQDLPGYIWREIVTGSLNRVAPLGMNVLISDDFASIGLASTVLVVSFYRLSVQGFFN
jgi:hypothetical protein